MAGFKGGNGGMQNLMRQAQKMQEDMEKTAALLDDWEIVGTAAGEAVVVYMNADGLGLFWKAIIIGLANLFGVYVVKFLEEKNRKDKLWKVECTVARTKTSALDEELKTAKISHNYVIVGYHTAFNCYCATQNESLAVKNILAKYNAKYFVTESKTL